MIQQINYLKRRIRLAMNKEERLQLENELLMTCSKAQAINKYIDELEESSKLSELWCKSQEENKELQQKIDKAIEYVNNHTHQETFTGYMDSYELKKLLEILKGDSNE